MAGKKLITNPKAQDLLDFKGLSVIIFFKNVTLSIENGDGSKSEGTAVKGFVVKVTDAFVYLGADPDVYDTVVAVEDVSIIRVPDEIEQLISAFGGTIPDTNNEDMQ